MSFRYTGRYAGILTFMSILDKRSMCDVASVGCVFHDVLSFLAVVGRAA